MAAVRHLELGKISIFGHVTYLHVIRHLHSELHVNRQLRHRDIAKKRFSIWRPSAIFNLKNFNF